MAPKEEENAVFLVLVPNNFVRGPASSLDGVDEDEREGESRENEEEEEEGEREGGRMQSSGFFLPLLLLHCDLELLLDPDPAMPLPPSLSPDVFQHLTLALSCSPSPSIPQSSTQATPTPTPSPQTSVDSSTAVKETLDPLTRLYSCLLREGLCNFVSRLRALHFSSYLHAIHTTLAHKHTVPPSAFQAAADICGRLTLSLDCTPLVGALCRHSLLSLLPSSPVETQASSTSTSTADGHSTPRKAAAIGSTENMADVTSTGEASKEADTAASDVECLPFGPETLSRLIQATSCIPASPVISSSYRLHFREQSSEEEGKRGEVMHCVQREGETQRLFEHYLEDSGFEGVPHCTGYYWLRGEDTEPQRKAKKLSRGRESGGGGQEAGSLLSSHSEASTIQHHLSLNIDMTLQNGGSGMPNWF